MEQVARAERTSFECDWRVVLLVAMVLVVCAAALGGCGGGDGDGGMSQEQERIQDFNVAVGAWQQAMVQVGARADEMEQIVTAHGDDLYAGPSAPLSQAELEAHASALEQWGHNYREAFVASYDMVKAAQAMEAEQQTSGLWFALPGGELEQTYQAELFTLTGMAVFAAAVSVSTWLACKKTEEAKTKACRNIRNIIQATLNQKCLDAYARELHMDDLGDVSKEDILEHIDNHPGRASFCTKASFSMQSLTTSGELAGTNCQVPSAQDVTETRFEVTQDVVETGANYNVSMMTTVTSTPASLLLQGSKLSEGAKAATELGITVTEAAMEEYGSKLPEEVTVVGVSDDKTVGTIPPSSSTNTPSQAVSVVLDDESPADLVKQAFDDVVVEVANTAKLPLTTTGLDGSQSIDVPNNVFVGSYPVSGLKESVTVPIPNIGFGTVLVLSPETVPEVTEQVDTAQNSAIDFSGIGIPQWGEEPKKSEEPEPPSGDGLTVKAPPGDVVAGSDVTLLVYCPDAVSFPATLDSNTLSGVSLAWGSVNACPIEVIFNADAAGSYTVQFTLTDDGGNAYKGNATLAVVAAHDGECLESQNVACHEALENDSSCFDGCPAEAAGKRAHEACKWYCSAAKAHAKAQCGYENGCVTIYTQNSACTSKCNFAYSACLEALDSDDPDSLGGCPSDQGQCLAPCMQML